MRELKQNECKGQCDWKRAGEEVLDGQPLFECGACGSEWVPSEEWTPRNADGEIAPEVAAARAAATPRGAVGQSGGSGGSW